MSDILLRFFDALSAGCIYRPLYTQFFLLSLPVVYLHRMQVVRLSLLVWALLLSLDFAKHLYLGEGLPFRRNQQESVPPAQCLVLYL